MSTSWKEALQLAALGVGVTILGLVVGAFVISPAVSREQRIAAFVALGGAAGLVLLVELGQRAVRALRRRQRRPSVRAMRAAVAGRTATSAAPALSLRSGRGNRTPRTVQALAAAGTAPTEIAWKTGLPLDAVSMLLEINGGALARQL
jgi:hypothetical protein